MRLDGHREAGVGHDHAQGSKAICLSPKSSYNHKDQKHRLVYVPFPIHVLTRTKETAI
jgi:hypothetical protein